MPTGPGPSCLLDQTWRDSLPWADGEGVDGRATGEVECRDARVAGFVYVPGPESKSVPFLFIHQHTFMIPASALLPSLGTQAEPLLAGVPGKVDVARKTKVREAPSEGRPSWEVVDGHLVVTLCPRTLSHTLGGLCSGKCNISVLEAGSRNPDVSRAVLPQKAPRADPFCLFQLQEAQVSLACGGITPVSAFVVTWSTLLCDSSLLLRTPVIAFRAPLIQQDPVLHLQRPYFQIRPEPQIPGVRLPTLTTDGVARVGDE